MTSTRKDGDYKRTAFIGINKTGKSSRMLELLQDSYHFNLQHGVYPENVRIVIVCQTTPDAYKKIKRLTTYAQLHNFESGIALFWDYTRSPEEMLRHICLLIDEGEQNGKKYLQNGALILEDCSHYIEHNPARPIKALLDNHRMYHLDLFFTVHSLFDLSAYIRRRIMFYRLFKTLDEIQDAGPLEKIRFPNAQNIYHGWVQVMNDPNPFANVTIKTGQ